MKAAFRDGSRTVWERLFGRSVYIWGAGQQGRGMARLLDRKGFRIRGFLDSSPQLRGQDAVGYPIYDPEAILCGSCDNERPFIIIASFFFEDEIMERCRAFGLRDGEDFASYKQLKPFDYVVDVSGACNLRCISCPRAGRHERHPPAGFMEPAVFERVIEKILREDPLVGSLQLYQWGEPLLNPHLPEIISIANAKGLPCAVSSNLNVNRSLEPVIKAAPAWFRISISGVGEDYERTHTGASWPRLLANMESLAALRARYNPGMKTEVYYHLYRHNQKEPFEQVRAICERLSFELHPVWAYLISLDDVLEHLEGNPLSPEAEKASAMLALDLKQGMELARKESHKECLVDRCIHINWNLAVSHCMMFFYPQENTAAADFLTTPLEEIAAARASCRLCRRCRAQALHRYCSVYATESTEAIGGSTQ